MKKSVYITLGALLLSFGCQKSTTEHSNYSPPSPRVQTPPPATFTRDEAKKKFEHLIHQAFSCDSKREIRGATISTFQNPSIGEFRFKGKYFGEHPTWGDYAGDFSGTGYKQGTQVHIRALEYKTVVSEGKVKGTCLK